MTMETAGRKMNSLDYYFNLYSDYNRRFSISRKTQDAGEIMTLLEMMMEELIIYLNSPLLNMAFSACYGLCIRKRLVVWSWKPENFTLTEPAGRTVMPPFDGWTLVTMLADHMQDKNCPGKVELEEAAQYFYKNCEIRHPDITQLSNAAMLIDGALPRLRENIYREMQKKKDWPDPDQMREIVITQLVRDEIGERISTEIGEAQRQKEEILEEGRKQADKLKEAILEEAGREAEEVKKRAYKEAEERLCMARNRMTSDGAEERRKNFETAQSRMNDGFSEVRKSMLGISNLLKQMEKAAEDQLVRKAFDQYLELYNLIADYRDSVTAKAREKKDTDLENAAWNLDVFLDIICEYLADYGIQSTASLPGEKFSPGIHEAVDAGEGFDPRKETVRTSLRNGFVWGEQVLQKEKVRIRKDD